MITSSLSLTTRPLQGTLPKSLVFENIANLYNLSRMGSS